MKNTGKIQQEILEQKLKNVQASIKAIYTKADLLIVEKEKLERIEENLLDTLYRFGRKVQKESRDSEESNSTQTTSTSSTIETSDSFKKP